MVNSHGQHAVDQPPVSPFEPEDFFIEEEVHNAAQGVMTRWPSRIKEIPTLDAFEEASCLQGTGEYYFGRSATDTEHFKAHDYEEITDEEEFAPWSPESQPVDSESGTPSFQDLKDQNGLDLSEVGLVESSVQDVSVDWEQSEEARVRKIAGRVKLPAHGKSFHFFQLADPLSALLIQIETGTYNDAGTVEALYAQEPGRSMVATIITNWSSSTGRNLKKKPVTVAEMS
jgi:hypothetical protein